MRSRSDECDADKMAMPTFSDTALPRCRLTVVVPTVSVKVTEPVGTVELLVGSVTVAER